MAGRARNIGSMATGPRYNAMDRGPLRLLRRRSKSHLLHCTVPCNPSSHAILMRRRKSQTR